MRHLVASLIAGPAVGRKHLLSFGVGVVAEPCRLALHLSRPDCSNL